MNSIHPSRRRFLGQAGCAALGSISMLNTLINLKLANHAAAQSSFSDRKTLVCIFLHGGNDSFNMLVPRDPARYSLYSAARGNLALTQTQVASGALNQAAGGDGQLYSIHPSCTGLRELFNGIGGDAAQRRLAIVANVGTLVQPTSKAQYLAESVTLPRALFSHSDQIDHWQTSVPQGLAQLAGWGGRAADVLHGSSNTGQTSMSISFDGNNLFQVGNNTQQFVVTPGGALTFTASGAGSPNPLTVKNNAHRSLIAQHYGNLMQESFGQLTKTSVDLQAYFQTLFNTFDEARIQTPFPGNNYLGDNLRAVAKTIALREQLGLRRQTIFLTYGGWDHHAELLTTQAGMLSYLDEALFAFQKTLEELALQNDVITFTCSDFGRTLRSNGNGTDHAWGGNALVMGGPIQGGRVVGTFPDLTLDGNDDIGYGGRLLPSTSVDKYFAEMLRWFGVTPANMSYVLPNIANFYNVNSSTLPLGFLRPGTWT